MIATIKDPNNGHIEITSTNPIFKKEIGTVLTDLSALYKVMGDLTSWANNEHEEAMLFEVED